jgi:acyl carrier protein
MDTQQRIENKVRDFIVQVLEFGEDELASVANESILTETPLFLDSVDLLQIYADCERYYGTKLGGKSNFSKSSIASIAKLINQQLNLTENKNEKDNFFTSATGINISVPNFIEQITYVADKSALINQSSDNAEFKITDNNPIKMMQTAFALLIAGKIPLLSANFEGKQTICWRDLSNSVDFSSMVEGEDVHKLHSSRLYLFFNETIKDQIIGFETSGSTGKPEVFYKSISSMWLETQTIANEIDFNPIDFINAFVSPVHMYGFIWSFLLPIYLNKPVHYQETGPIDTNPLGTKKALCIIVPTIWDLLGPQLNSNISFIVNSAAAFGEQRETEFLAKKKSNNIAIKGIDVLGSTETGGLGYRYFGQDASGFFTLFKRVNLTAYSKNNISVKSPFLPLNLDEFYLSDQIEIISDRKIMHLGRKDKIFKYKGKRISLVTMERKLDLFFSGKSKKLFFINEQDNKKGGRLLVFIESDQKIKVSSHEIKAEFVGFPTPKITIMEKFPLNSLGKVTLSSLQECTLHV